LSDPFVLIACVLFSSLDRPPKNSNESATKHYFAASI
jgi:hypothetical protein